MDVLPTNYTLIPLSPHPPQLLTLSGGSLDRKWRLSLTSLVQMIYMMAAVIRPVLMGFMRVSCMLNMLMAL